MKIQLLIALLLCSIQGYSQNMDSLLTSLYFSEGLTISDTNGFDFNLVYNPSPSYWAIDSFPESVVFNADAKESGDSGLKYITESSANSGIG
mgnify:CR=1 FL=1